MTSLASGVSPTHTYQGSSEISFFLDEQEQLTVTLDTDNLHIRSVEEGDLDSYAALFGDKDVISKYATGQTKTREEMETRIKDTWVKRWHQKDPYAGLAVFKTATDEFLGHVILGHGDAAGQSELAYLFAKGHWHKGVGTEAVTAVVQEYAPATVEEGYILDGKPLEKITATARSDNPFSVKILTKLGMHKTGEEEKYGAVRQFFSIGLDELKKPQPL
jgi:[ribosomal protein S5]-alanine N-acetyltransferase